MRYSEDQLLPLSALQHLVFCERQCALIHLEGIWADNRLTTEGRLLHETVDEGSSESRRDLRISRSLPLASYRLGLAGRSDVVEWQRLGPEDDGPGFDSPLPNLKGRWAAVPVEYKRGKPKTHRADEVQLCAQALCLEEMLRTVEGPTETMAPSIEQGALFYLKTRRRLVVRFDLPLRQLTERSARRLHALLASGTTPPAAQEAKCASCSLQDMCLPHLAGRSALRYTEILLQGGSPDLSLEISAKLNREAEQEKQSGAAE